MKVAIVASPRTGSTWLYEILLQYLRQRDPDLLALEEYFNVEQLQAIFLPKDPENFSAKSMTIFSLKSNLEPPSKGYQLIYQWDMNGIRKIFVPFTKDMIGRIKDMLKAGVWNEYRTIESRARLEWLKKDSRNTVLIKVMSEDLEDNPELADYLSQNFKIIFLTRENFLDQVKSYSLSMASGVWHSKELALEKIGNELIQCQKDWVDAILNQVANYTKWRERMNPSQSQEVSYEQLCEFPDSKAILNFLGFEHSGGNLPQVVRQSGPKRFFSNAGQVLSWLKATRVAIISSPGSGSEKLYQFLLDYQQQNHSTVLSLGEYANIRSLRNPSAGGYHQTYQWGTKGIEAVRVPVTPEMITQFQFMERIGAWPEFRATETRKRVDWLVKDSRKVVLLEVMAQDFEENPELADFLKKNYKLIFFKREASEVQDENYTNLRESMNGPQYLEVSYEQLESWGDPAVIARNLFFQHRFFQLDQPNNLNNRLRQWTGHSSLSPK